MKFTFAICTFAAALAAAGCAVDAGPATSRATAALTTDDVDVAPECTGILTYANVASFGDLDSFLPSDVANGIVARRAIRPFSSLADLSSVSGIAQARLALIAHRALQVEFIGEDCAGVYEELAVSASDRDAILAYVNTASVDELARVVRSEPTTTLAQALVAARPLTTLQQLVDLSDVGPSTFRALRDAAIQGPFDLLAARVNAVGRDAAIATAFDWIQVMFEEPGRPTHIECFGIAADIVARTGGTVRSTLADGAEVMNQVAQTVGYADRFHDVGDATAGLADLSAQVTGQTFFGCYLRFEPDPFSGVHRAFFVNKVTGYRVFTETRFSE